jgi:hypothetical protein
MKSTPGRWTCIALVVLLAPAPPVSFAQGPDPGDARHCLDLGDIVEVVRCAEPYRHRRASARAVPAAPPAAPTPAKAVPASAPAAAAAPATPPPPAPKRKRRAGGVDARHCLDLGDVLAIARCAEKYR